jgi:hypothetical protein
MLYSKTIKFPIIALVIFTVLTNVILMPALVAAQSGPPTSGEATMVIYYPPTVNDSYTDMTINGGEKLPGWCVDKYVYIYPNREYQVVLIDYFGYPPITELPPPGTYPAYIEDVPWDYIAYILNHKQGNASDIQQAFWYFSDGLTPTSAITQAIISDTEANGNGFIPGPSQIRPILCDLGNKIQLTFFELENPDPVTPKVPDEQQENVPVGIEVHKVDKTGLVIPYLGLLGLLMFITAFALLFGRLSSRQS